VVVPQEDSTPDLPVVAVDSTAKEEVPMEVDSTAKEAHSEEVAAAQEDSEVVTSVVHLGSLEHPKEVVSLLAQVLSVVLPASVVHPAQGDSKDCKESKDSKDCLVPQVIKEVALLPPHLVCLLQAVGSVDLSQVTKPKASLAEDGHNSSTALTTRYLLT